MIVSRFDRIALVVGAVLVGATVIEASWPHDLAVPSATASEAEGAAATLGTSVAPYPARTELAELAQRPLFTVDRRPYVPPPLAEKPPTGPAPPTIDAVLVGIARAADAQVILVRVQNAPTVHRLRLGGQIEGWTVTNIGARTATLASNGHERELSLAATARP